MLPAEAPEYIRRAEQIIEFTNLGEEERYMISLEEKYKADQIAYQNTARNEGASTRELEIARNMKAEGSETAFIMKVTGLSEETISAL